MRSGCRGEYLCMTSLNALPGIPSSCLLTKINKPLSSYYKTEHGYPNTKQNMVIPLRNRTWLSQYKTEHGYPITKHSCIHILLSLPVGHHTVYYFPKTHNSYICFNCDKIIWVFFVMLGSIQKKIEKKPKSMHDCLAQPMSHNSSLM